MEGFLRQKKNTKNYYAVVMIEDEFGVKKKREFSTGTDNEKKAKKFLRELMTKVDNGDIGTCDKMKFGDYIDRFISFKEKELSPTTIKDYKLILQQHVKPLLGHLYIDKLKAIHLQEYYTLKLATLSSSTVHKHHRVIKKALGNALKLGLITKNPAELADPPKVQKSTVGKALNIDDTKTLLSNIIGERIEIPVMLAMLCGMRRGEICGLRWSDVDLKQGTITIQQSMVKVGGAYLLKKPKSNESIRTFQAPSIVVEKLGKLDKIIKENKLKFGATYEDNGFVICHENGEHINPDWLTRELPIILKKLNLPKIRFHDLRHTNATIMLQAGVPLKVASERLGHSSVKITGDLYSHVTKSLDEDASTKIDDLYKTATKTATKTDEKYVVHRIK